mgnify:CR=1 FL=1
MSAGAEGAVPDGKIQKSVKYSKDFIQLISGSFEICVQNGWVDGKGDLYVIYPKSEMKKDLNTTRYGVDQAVQELVEVGNLVRIIPNNGKANHFYINDYL